MLHKVSISVLLLLCVCTARAQQVSNKAKGNGHNSKVASYPTFVPYIWHFDTIGPAVQNNAAIDMQHLLPASNQHQTLGSMAEQAMNYKYQLNEHTMMRIGYRGTTLGLDFHF